MFIKICCWLLTFSLLAASEVDSFLQSLLSKTAIIDTKQIKIRGYPNAYNPSLIPYKDGYLLSFRFISRRPDAVKTDFRTDLSFIGVARLDKKFRVSEKTIQLLNIISHSQKISLTAEDARLFNIDNRIFIFFNDLPLFQTHDGFAMYFAELIEERGIFVLKGPAKLLNYPFAISIEKNWSPFLYGNKLYMIYSAQPQIILEVDLNTGHCQEVVREYPHLHWNLGIIRGGTPAYPINDQLITFFHSSFPAQISKGRAYIMGAYIFDKDPPFSIRAMTPTPLGDLSYYTEGNSTKIVFPGGLVVQDHHILVAWGKNDKQIFITTFDKAKLLASMEPKSADTLLGFLFEPHREEPSQNSTQKKNEGTVGEAPADSEYSPCNCEAQSAADLLHG